MTETAEAYNPPKGAKSPKLEPKATMLCLALPSSPHDLELKALGDACNNCCSTWGENYPEPTAPTLLFEDKELRDSLLFHMQEILELIKVAKWGDLRGALSILNLYFSRQKRGGGDTIRVNVRFEHQGWIGVFKR